MQFMHCASGTRKALWNMDGPMDRHNRKCQDLFLLPTSRFDISSAYTCLPLGDDKENRVKRADRKEETNYSLKWGFGSPIALSTRIVRELSLNVITAISTYSDPNPWTNEALNAAAKELEVCFILRRSASTDRMSQLKCPEIRILV